ncbi:MarR family winged helix-turn-helix transcriptional regulator [Nonomuraea basaltis]|uniref:MarR family winged helix-turn-helix transcriptional regulator n=1 Tax=Nonomuraea basaltis TaxID=2495887 RepID=UPI00110C6ED5|nr:MarR family transcriptional regulator [Nonomuraea basaltis]TMR95642.1 MarR family transcriptional regulator [Nonomuraea basaltis]
MEKNIGYWLKNLDTLLESAMDDALQMTRREWQVLNTTAHDARPDELAPFTGIDEAVEQLTARGWLADGRITEAGRAAHAGIVERVAAFRQQVSEGVTPEEYRATVDVLRRMAANLDPAAV